MKRPYPELAKALYSLTKDQTEKVAAETVRSFALQVQKRFGRNALAQVLKQLPVQAKRIDGIEDVLVETARPLSSESVARALADVGIDAGKSEVRIEVKPELVGGIRIRRSDTLIDSTIRRKLDRLAGAGQSS
jgi:F0F1-type ATP synthase delta subunit